MSLGSSLQLEGFSKDISAVKGQCMSRRRKMAVDVLGIILPARPRAQALGMLPGTLTSKRSVLGKVGA